MHLGGGQATRGEHDAGGQDARDEQVDQLVIQRAAHNLQAK